MNLLLVAAVVPVRKSGVELPEAGDSHQAREAQEAAPGGLIGLEERVVDAGGGVSSRGKAREDAGGASSPLAAQASAGGPADAPGAAAGARLADARPEQLAPEASWQELEEVAAESAPESAEPKPALVKSTGPVSSQPAEKPAEGLSVVAYHKLHPDTSIDQIVELFSMPKTQIQKLMLAQFGGTARYCRDHNELLCGKILNPDMTKKGLSEAEELAVCQRIVDLLGLPGTTFRMPGTAPQSPAARACNTIGLLSKSSTVSGATVAEKSKEMRTRLSPGGVAGYAKANPNASSADIAKAFTRQLANHGVTGVDAEFVEKTLELLSLTKSGQSNPNSGGDGKCKKFNQNDAFFGLPEVVEYAEENPDCTADDVVETFPDLQDKRQVIDILLVLVKKAQLPNDCVDMDVSAGYKGGVKDECGNTCRSYNLRVDFCGLLDNDDFAASVLCCACRGGEKVQAKQRRKPKTDGTCVRELTIPAKTFQIDGKIRQREGHRQVKVTDNAGWKELPVGTMIHEVMFGNGPRRTGKWTTEFAASPAAGAVVSFQEGDKLKVMDSRCMRDKYKRRMQKRGRRLDEDEREAAREYWASDVFRANFRRSPRMRSRRPEQLDPPGWDGGGRPPRNPTGAKENSTAILDKLANAILGQQGQAPGQGAKDGKLPADKADGAEGSAASIPPTASLEGAAGGPGTGGIVAIVVLVVLVLLGGFCAWRRKARAKGKRKHKGDSDDDPNFAQSLFSGGGGGDTVASYAWDGSFEPGQTVECTRAVETDSADDRVIPEGTTGYVVSLEADGALLIDFDGEDQSVYVLPAHHGGLKVVQ